MEAYKTLDLKDGGVLEIHYDQNGESPRSWDNLGTVAAFHKRYDIGDKVDFSSDDFNGWDEMKAYIKKKYKPIAILPIYMYSHSGITINTTGYSCPWDSGQIGFIYVTQKRIDAMGCTIDNGETWDMYVERMENYLRGEIETLDQYVRGDVYGYIVKDAEGEQEDSCWGFYGDDIQTNGMLDYVGEDRIKLGEL
jgi:hypothetical protein